jgi:hypothetical protein
MLGDYVGLSYRSGNQVQSHHGERHLRNAHAWHRFHFTSCHCGLRDLRQAPAISGLVSKFIQRFGTKMLLTPCHGTPLQCTIRNSKFRGSHTPTAYSSNDDDLSFCILSLPNFKVTLAQMTLISGHLPLHPFSIIRNYGQQPFVERWTYKTRATEKRALYLILGRPSMEDDLSQGLGLKVMC